MNLKQVIFEENVQASKILYGISRKEKFFNAYITKAYKTHVLINSVLLQQKLEEIAELLVQYPSEHIVVVNAKPEYNNLLSVFSAINSFTLINGTYRVGCFTNINSNFINVGVLVSFHDRRDQTAIIDAKRLRRVKVVGITNLSRGCKLFDIYALVNNFSIKALILATWYITACIRQKKGLDTPSYNQYHTAVDGQSAN